MQRHELTPEEAAMLKRAFDALQSSPAVLNFNGRQQAIREIHLLPANAKLLVPDCKAFLIPDKQEAHGSTE